MKRFFIIFAFFFFSFAYSQDCSLSSCNKTHGSCVQEGYKVYSVTLVKTNEIDVSAMTSACQARLARLGTTFGRFEPELSKLGPTDEAVSCINTKNTHHGSAGRQPLIYKQKETGKALFCSLKRPDITSPGWCRSGYSSPIHIPTPSMLKTLGGRPVIRLICDDPYMNDLVYYDSWDDYAANRNPKFMADNKPSGADGGSGGSGSGSEGGGSGSEGGGSGSEGGGSDGGNGLSQTTLEDILHAINFAASNSTKAGIDAINFSNDAIAKAVRDGIDSSSVGSGGSGSGSGSGGEGSGGEGSELEIPEGLLTEDYIDGLLSDFISGSENIDDSEINSVNVESIDVAQFNKTYNVKLLASKQCPAPIPISFSMFGHAYNYYLTFDYLCMFAEVVGTLLLAAAYFSAAFIVARVSRR